MSGFVADEAEMNKFSFTLSICCRFHYIEMKRELVEIDRQHITCMCSACCISFHLSSRNVVFKADVCCLERQSFNIPATDVV